MDLNSEISYFSCAHLLELEIDTYHLTYEPFTGATYYRLFLCQIRLKSRSSFACEL